MSLKQIFRSREETKIYMDKLCGQIQRPGVILLSGEMGAGKTQVVRWLLESLGARDVASPTFAIHHAYETAQGTIDHVDLYRVESDTDLEASGFWDLLSQENGLVLIEWADRLPPSVWPQGWWKLFLHIEKVPGQEEARQLTIGARPD